MHRLKTLQKLFNAYIMLSLKTFLLIPNLLSIDLDSHNKVQGQGYLCLVQNFPDITSFLVENNVTVWKEC